MMHRIWLEDKQDRERVASIVKEYFFSFSLVSATGYWQGGSEASLCVEIDSLGVECKRQVLEVAERLREAFNQDAVLVQSIPCQSSLVVRKVNVDK